jgi:hypothetical protein
VRSVVCGVSVRCNNVWNTMQSNMYFLVLCCFFCGYEHSIKLVLFMHGGWGLHAVI